MTKTTKNDTLVDDVEEARALLMKHVLAGLRSASPKASLLAVCHRVVADEEERLARLKSFDFGTVAADLPFPVEDDTASGATAPAPATARPVDPSMEALLASLPFRTDEDDAA